MSSEGQPIAVELEGQLPYTSDVATVLAFVNFKSGGRRGNAIIKILQRELGEDHVFNLADGNPGQHIEKFRDTPNLRVVGCGGDGTVNWILSTVANMRMDPQPKVGIIPLGTGNDTSRHFGWGHKLRSERTVVQYIRNMQRIDCPSTPLDRWQLIINVPREKREFMHPFLQRMPEISPEAYASKASLLHSQHTNVAEAPVVAHQVSADLDTAPGDRAIDVSANSQTTISPSASAASEKDLHDDIHLIWSFNNYFSTGIDAQIMDSFHHHRERYPGCYCCRCCTMTWIGLQSPLNCCSCNKLPLRMDVDLLMPRSTANDGHAEPAVGDFEWIPSKLDAESLDAFIMLNLPTYAGGRDIWGKDKGKKTDKVSHTTPSSTSDGKLEVLGFDSYTHMSTTVALQTSRAHRLQQVIGARFSIKDHIILQLDGESWHQDCGSIEVFRAPSVLMMVNEPADAQGACCDC